MIDDAEVFSMTTMNTWSNAGIAWVAAEVEWLLEISGATRKAHSRASGRRTYRGMPAFL
jgi:hypothetical protein